MDLSKVDVIKVLEYFSCRNVREIGDEVQFSCPFPEHYRGDMNPSSSINKDNGVYNCFGCHRSGTIVNFVAEAEGVPVAVAIRWLREGFAPEFKNPDHSLLAEVTQLFHKELKTKQKLHQIPESVLDTFDVDWERVYEAYKRGNGPGNLVHPFRHYGLYVNSLESFRIGYDDISKRITIPIRTIRGELVGIKGRACKDENHPKYLAIGDKPEKKVYGFPRNPLGNAVFGLDTSDESVIICEGEFDAISLRQKGYDGSIALGTSDMTFNQERLIRSKATEAIVFFDPDAPGRKGALKVANRLAPHLPVRIVETSEGDPAECSPKQIEQALKNTVNPLDI